MDLINNPGGKDLAEIASDMSGFRIGARIRRIRTARGLSQAELGSMVGLSADRVQQYENGYRKPKMDKLKEIAAALGVETMAFTDPEVTNGIGAMYAFFEMERLYGAHVVEMAGRYLVEFEKGRTTDMSHYLEEWYNVHKDYEEKLSAATTQEAKEAVETDYLLWKSNFPSTITYKTEVNLRKARIKNQIEALQKELSDLNDGE